MKLSFLYGFLFGLILINAGFLFWSMGVWQQKFPPHFGEFVSQVFLAQIIPGANEAVFYLDPHEGTQAVNDTFDIELRIGSSAGVTSMRAYVQFDPQLLSIEAISTAGSVFSSWFEEEIDGGSGLIKLQAGEPSPGFSGSGANDGLVATITVKPIAEGSAGLSHEGTSLALTAADENILDLAKSTGAVFFVEGATEPGSGSAPPVSPGPESNGVPGDCNGDGRVNIFDLSILLSDWGRSNPRCDLSGDGTVGIFDISILMSNWTG